MDVGPRLQHPERLVSVSGLDDAVPCVLEHIGDEHADENLIFHDEDDGPAGETSGVWASSLIGANVDHC
jgi:hypothetical protein